MKKNKIDSEIKTSSYFKETEALFNKIVIAVNSLEERVNILECRDEQIQEQDK